VIKQERSRSFKPKLESPKVIAPSRPQTEADSEDENPRNTRLENLKAEVSYMLAKLQRNRYGQIIYDY